MKRLQGLLFGRAERAAVKRSAKEPPGNEPPGNEPKAPEAAAEAEEPVTEVWLNPAAEVLDKVPGLPQTE